MLGRWAIAEVLLGKEERAILCVCGQVVPLVPPPSQGERARERAKQGESAGGVGGLASTSAPHYALVGDKRHKKALSHRGRLSPLPTKKSPSWGLADNTQLSGQCHTRHNWPFLPHVPTTATELWNTKNAESPIA